MSPDAARRGRVLGLDHVALPMQDTDAMIAFYRSLGLPVDENPYLVQVYLGDQMINFHRPELWQGDFSLRAPAAVPPCGDLCFVWQGSADTLASRSTGRCRRHRRPGGADGGRGWPPRASTSATRTAISSSS